MAPRDNHPGRAGGEHARSKNSRDAGDRARGGRGGKGGGLSLSDPKLEAARQAAFNSPKGMRTRQLDTFTNERDFRAAAADAEDDGMFVLFNFFSPVTELSPWNGYWSPGQKRASYGVNPASVLGGIASAASGFPFGGTVLGKAYAAAGGPMIDVGPDVFGTDNLGPNLRDINSLSNGSWNGSRGLLGLGGDRPGIGGNRGAEQFMQQSLLGLANSRYKTPQPGSANGILPTPAQTAPAQDDTQKWQGGWRSIPGPTPYGFTAPSSSYRTAR